MDTCRQGQIGGGDTCQIAGIGGLYFLSTPLVLRRSVEPTANSGHSKEGISASRNGSNLQCGYLPKYLNRWFILPMYRALIKLYPGTPYERMAEFGQPDIQAVRQLDRPLPLA